MLNRVFTTSLVFSLVLAAPAAAEGPLPDSATIYEKVAAARGPQAHAYKETIAVSQSNGEAWTETEYVVGDDYRYDFRSSDDVETQRGRYKGDAWHQNANGQTVIHEAEPGLATKETYTTTVTRITDPVAGYRIAELNPRGWGNVDYVDASTWHIVREDTIDAAGTSIETYADFTKFGANTLAKTRRSHDADSGLDSTTTVNAYEAGTIGDADVAIPPNRRLLVEFPPGIDFTNLPVTFQHNRIYVMVTINGRGYDFLLDTGAAGISVDPGAAAKLGLHLFNQTRNSYNAGAFNSAQAKIDALAIGPLQMHNIYVHTAPVIEYGDGVASVGLLGFDFLAELGVRIDYVHQAVTVRRWGTYSTPIGPDINVIPIRLDDQTPRVSAKINGAVAERITVDTGADTSFMLFNYFARRHPEALVDHHAGGLFSRPVEFEGVGGTVQTRPYQLAEVDFGSVRFIDFVGYLVKSASYGTDDDGLFGSDFLRFYDVYLDYPSGQIALRLNDDGRKAAHH
jgi:predicted aspartyl protease